MQFVRSVNVVTSITRVEEGSCMRSCMRCWFDKRCFQQDYSAARPTRNSCKKHGACRIGHWPKLLRAINKHYDGLT